MDPLTSALGIGSKLIDRLWPDPEAREKAKAHLLEIQQRGELAELDGEIRLAMEQARVNAEAAKNPSVFVAGARPFIIWICGAALLFHYLLVPFIEVILSVTMDPPPPIPHLSMSELYPVLMGLLGLGGMRSYEKRHGVARETLE